MERSRQTSLGAATAKHHAHVRSTAPGGRVANVSFNEADLATLAQQAAAASGDATPSLIQHVAATRQLATDVGQGGDVVNSSTPSYLVVVQGSFTMQVPVPPLPPTIPKPAPRTVTYSVMTLVVDAATGQITDNGFANAYPNLTSIGPVTTDKTAQ